MIFFRTTSEKACPTTRGVRFILIVLPRPSRGGLFSAAGSEVIFFIRFIFILSESCASFKPQFILNSDQKQLTGCIVSAKNPPKFAREFLCNKHKPHWRFTQPGASMTPCLADGSGTWPAARTLRRHNKRKYYFSLLPAN